MPHAVQQTPATCVVYLRLGDKSNSGDTRLTFASGFYESVMDDLQRRQACGGSCWIVTQTPQEPRAVQMAKTYGCELVSSASGYADWAVSMELAKNTHTHGAGPHGWSLVASRQPPSTHSRFRGSITTAATIAPQILYRAPKVLVMAPSTYCWAQALLGPATEIHYPAVGFFHSKHNVRFKWRRGARCQVRWTKNIHSTQPRQLQLPPTHRPRFTTQVCMRQGKVGSHFGQIRLPIDDARMVYHDLYSGVGFLSYQELYSEMRALSCESILQQHVCEPEVMKKFWTGTESRYCYHTLNATTAERAIRLRQAAYAAGSEAVSRHRSGTREAVAARAGGTERPGAGPP